ncbi:hypothetical protein ZYGR_0AS05130 [Zygosaccharomyces rouxii]|uniref:Transferrin receptor-like dimerisation domain-containing protein n=1 Tax=Zygosaccharomyces rouxii TaxID=4956 RepID=A0A1Q3AHI7_ZYGRO|nr:hypothetical protein ZYGR_0AS05130 [Zygosaccharomyces rouxii]
MRIPGLRSGYDRVPDQEAQEPVENEPEIDQDSLPLDPPEYDYTFDAEPDSELNNGMEQMEYEDESTAQEPVGKIRRFRDSFSNNIVIPVREKIMDPLAQIISMLSDRIDYYLNKVGNPLILRRFFYIVLMSIIAYVVMVSGLLPTELSLGSRGMFSDYQALMDYAKKSVDLSKFERDLEYISSMPHMSGTKGDTAIRNYILESFTNNGIRLIRESTYAGYSNYPGEVSLKAVHNSQEIVIDVNQENYNPLSKNGELHDVTLIFANYGSLQDLENLRQNGLLNGEFILLEHYSAVVSEQVLAAEKYGAKGILFITDKQDDKGDEVQDRPVGKPQVWPGDALTPGWPGNGLQNIDPKSATSLPNIPTMPLSWNQALKLLNLLSKSGVQFADSTFSGQPGEVLISMKINTIVRERHPVDNLLGKIEGGEQNDKAVIISASRTSIFKGTSYPSFGTTMLLSIVQLFQELKYKFDWKPLRNVYFASYGGSEFNLAGAVELLEENVGPLRDEIYSVIDLSQLVLPIDERRLDIQSHPLLQEFFENEESRFGYNVNVRNVQEYGDWIPLMANGVPVSIISSPAFLEGKSPLFTSADDFERVKDLLHGDNERQAVSDLLLFLFQSVLKVADNPSIPFSVMKYVHSVDDAIQDLGNNYPGRLDSQELVKALLLWRKIGEEWAAWSKGWDNIVMTRDEGIEPSLLSVRRWTWNKKLANIGRRQCKNEGLPNRPFYKNVLFGPAYWTQAVKGDPWIFPSVKDAIVDEDWNRAQNELNSVAQILQQSAALFLEETNDI